jgi:hypothetical protein
VTKPDGEHRPPGDFAVSHGAAAPAPLRFEDVRLWKAVEESSPTYGRPSAPVPAAGA